MATRRPLRRLLPILLSTTALQAGQVAHADPTDPWWNDDWPYRIPVSVSGSGVAEVSVDFTQAFTLLGLPGALLDIRSIRVVPYQNGAAQDPLPYEEDYSTLLDDADSPQIGWHPSGVYWDVNDGTATADQTRASQGQGSLKAVVENLPGRYGYPGVELRIATGDPLTDWHWFESFVYDVWPEVNQSALDQAPDLYWFKLYNTTGCAQSNITQGGPPLALGEWNPVSVSLRPLDTCTTPSLTNITRMEFHTRDNETVNGNSGLWDDGDQLTLWFDNLRLVDQEQGTLRWQTSGGIQDYYIYFDTLIHSGHPPPETTALPAATLTAQSGAPESGGYFHRPQGIVGNGPTVWSAPVVEKILQTQTAPVAEAPLRISAARGELESFQLVVRSATSQSVAIGISPFVKGADRIETGNVELFRVDYVPLTQLSDAFGRIGNWPDPLYPLVLGTSVSLAPNVSQPLWFTVEVPGDAPAGLYQATVTIGGRSVPVQLEVFDFTLPPQQLLEGEWGFGWSQVVDRYRGTVGGSVQPCYWDLVDALYEQFARDRLVPKGVGWPAGLNYPGGVEYDCNGNLDPDAWGDWDFETLAGDYLRGAALDNGVGFDSFLIRGPANNWPPDSRPSSFCDQSRGTDPPGSSAYNTKWFQYWSAVSDYLWANPDYAQKGYYHIVNEPQTFDDYDIVAYLAQQTKQAAPYVRILVSEQVEPAIYANGSYPGAEIDIWMPTISNYQPRRAQERQRDHGESVWWYFLYGDRPPLPNPTVIDRPGIEARIIPWAAWLERVDGLVYYSTTDWSPDPWTQPWINAGNGDGFMFYPPKDGTLAFDACNAHSNRLVPSIRWELLREGMEDYAYLWLLNDGAPGIGEASQADRLAQRFIASRTRFDRIPTHLAQARSALATSISGSSDCSGDVVNLSGQTFPAGSTTACVAQTSITVGPDVIVEGDADLALLAPVIRLRPGFRVDPMAMVTVKLPSLP